jgi:hypothetical protein
MACGHVAMALCAITSPVFAQSIEVDTSSASGVYSELDPAVREVDEMTLSRAFGNWRLAASVETHVQDFQSADPMDERWKSPISVQPGIEHVGAAMIDSVSLSLSRFERLAPNLWASASLDFNLAADADFRAYYTEQGSFEAGLMYWHGDTFVWANQQRDFVSSDLYLTRDTWQSEIGLSRTASKDTEYGLMVSRTQYPFEEWGSSTSISAFGTRETRLGPVKGWIAGQRTDGRNGVSAAVTFETRY